MKVSLLVLKLKSTVMFLISPTPPVCDSFCDRFIDRTQVTPNLLSLSCIDLNPGQQTAGFMSLTESAWVKIPDKHSYSSVNLGLPEPISRLNRSARCLMFTDETFSLQLLETSGCDPVCVWKSRRRRRKKTAKLSESFCPD